MKSPENQLTEDLVAYWDANRPAGFPADWPIYHHHRTEDREKPCLIIGHEGAGRVPSMPDTARVNLRAMVLTDMDTTGSEAHRAVAGAIEEALEFMDMKPGPLANTYVHDLLKESPETGMDQEKREEFTVMKRMAVVSKDQDA